MFQQLSYFCEDITGSIACFSLMEKKLNRDAITKTKCTTFYGVCVGVS